MITLITGTPGAGKTLYCLTEVCPAFEGRPFYVDGIPDLLINHDLPSGPVESETQSYADWLPDNGVLVVDEAQRIWRPRSSSSKVPRGVEAMETHRHHGHDLVLVTQHPNLLDSNVRRLVGRHLHVRRVWGMSRALVYEWDQATDPNRISTATKSSWAYPKKAFGLYKSATVHTNRGQRPPFLVFVVLVLPILLGYFGYISYQSIKARTQTPTAVVGVGVGAVPQATAMADAKPFDVSAFVPVIPSEPASAPAYDHLRHVVVMPRVAACISSASRCICYTQQSTRLNMPESDCRLLASDPRFDSFSAPVASPPLGSERVSPAAPESSPPEREPVSWS